MALRDRVNQIQQQRADLEANQNTGTFGDITDLVQKGAIDAIGGVAKFVGADQTAKSLGQWSEEQMQTLTPEMKTSMAKRFINDDLSVGEGVKDWRAWVGQAAVLAGQMIPSLLPAGAAVRGAQAVGAGARVAQGASTLTSMAANAAIATGMQGQQVEDEIMNLSYQDLTESQPFRERAVFYAEQGLPAEEVLLRAKRDVARQATDQVLRDPTLIGVNAVAGMVGDKAMPKLITGKFGQTIRGNIAKGAAAEGVTESFQGGYGQYVSNVAQGDAGLEVDAMQGVVAAALEEGLIAGGLGGASGGVGGAFNKITKKVQAREQIEPIIEGAVEELAATGFDRAEAEAQIQRMAEEAAIRMGSDAETASEAAAEAVAASVGRGPTIQEQNARIMERVQQAQAARQDQAGTRGLGELAYDVGGRTGRMQQAAQQARADNVQYQQQPPAYDPRQTTIQDMYDEAADVMDDTGVEREDALTPQDIINMRAEEAADYAAEGQAERAQGRIQAQQEYLRGGRLPEGYEPTEAARRIRQEQGVDLREQYAAQEAEFGREPGTAPTTETPEQARQRVRGQMVAEGLDQRQREAGLAQMEADQAAWDQRGEADTIEAATATTDQPQTTRMVQDVVEPRRQRREPVRPSELTPQQQVDRYRGQTTGQLRGQLGQRQATGASPRLAKKNTAKLNRKLNTIFERITQANPEATPETQTFGYQPNQAMAEAFAALQPTTGEPTPDQFNQRVDQLVANGTINESEANQVKEALDIPRSRQPRRTTTPTTETGVPIDEVAGDYQSVSAVADQQWDSEPATPAGVNTVNDTVTIDGEDQVITSVQSNPPYVNVVNPKTNESKVVSAEELNQENIVVQDVNDDQPSPEEEYDVEADLGPDFEEDYGMAEPTPPAPKVFEGATYDPQSRLGDTEWQESGGWSNEGATPIPDQWKNVSDTKEYVVSQERAGRAYSIWSRPKETTGQTMESGKEYDWDGDTVRFNDEIGRIQRRNKQDAQFGEKGWSNMKFNWMKQFTEDTGVEIPQEMMDAHRAKRRKPTTEEVVEAPTEEQAQAAADAQAKADKRATDKAKRLERERQKDVIGKYTGIDKALAAMERVGVMETHYPHKLVAGPVSKAEFEVRKLPEKVDGTFKIHGWSTDTMSGFFIEGANARELSPFAMLAGRGRGVMTQNAPSAIDWKDIKGIGLKTPNSPDFLRMVIERGGKFDSYDSAITEMLNEIESDTKELSGPERTKAIKEKRQLFEDIYVFNPENPDVVSYKEATDLEPSAYNFSEWMFKREMDEKGLDVASPEITPELRAAAKERSPKTRVLQRATSEIVKRQSKTDVLSGSQQRRLSELQKEIRDADSLTPEQAADFDQRINDIIGADTDIEAQVKAKTDKIMASAKTGEFMSKFRRLRSGQIKPDQVIRGASNSTNPRKTAFEWLYKEINNADPQNPVLTGVGLGSNGKPFKSEIGARNQGKGQQASAVVPASSIIDGEEGFVWVKYRDTDPDGGGSKTKAEPTVKELERDYDRLLKGELDPNDVTGYKNLAKTRQNAVEYFIKAIHNSNPANRQIQAVGVPYSGDPYKTEAEVRDTGMVKHMGFEPMPYRGGFVAVRYADHPMAGGLASDSPIATQPKGAIKSATSMVTDIANQLFVPGMLPEHAQLKVDSFFNTMDYTNYIASLPAYQNRKENVSAWKAQNRQLKNLRDQKDEIIIALANKAQAEQDLQEQPDVPDTARDLERDTGQDTLDQEPSESERRRLVRERDREIDDAVEQGRTTGRREPSIPATGPLDAGTSNIDTVDQPDGQPSAPTGVTGSTDPRGNDLSSGAGVSVDEAAAEAVISGQATDGVELSREEQQTAADKVAVKLNDAKNIDKTLPLLSPEQRTDVVAAEKRLYGQKHKGMMFTNGTGTGKTYTGNGIIKRVVRNGGKVLVVAPAGTIKGWQNSAKDLQFDMVKLKDKSSGLGDNSAVITSYQNFSDNQTLLQDKFDLVVYDEAHKIMANMQGDATKATAYHYAITGKDGKSRGSLVYRPEIDKVKEDMKAYQKAEKEKGNEISDPQLYEIPKFSRRLNAINRKIDKLDKQFQKLEKKAPTKALFLSASPFSGHKSVFYADGYLFDTEQGFKQGGYNSGSPQQQYMVKNFGYRMRYNKANQPGAEVDVGLLERDWADQMFESGAMVGRTLNLSQDYSRQFPQVDQGVGAKIDALFNAVVKDNKYPELSKALYAWRKNGKDRQLAEALRVAGSLDRIEEHLKLGRKVVVFHQRMEMTITDPFAGPLTPEGMKELREFNKEFPELRTMSFVGLESAPKQIIDHFGPDRVGLFNGQVTKTRNSDLKEFNKDGGSKDILVIQKDAGKEGLSAHDITGQNQRALIITNTPQSPADAIQMEGRIYRFGLQTNAVIEYPTVQTNFEKIAFRDVVSNRTATAENLAMGSQARMLRTAFRDGYTEPYQRMPNNDQGVGGKDSDRTVGETSQLDRAKTYYYKRAKKTQATKAAEGADYFATPEPVGLAMVNMAGLLPGETALEPSAGHGAIAHWFPESVTATAIEQSPELIGDLSMFTDADVRHQDFEALNIVNKYDGVVMNPPFGHGGNLAMQHINKATKHLNNGGRVVAIYPMGGLADKRFDKWYEEEAKDIYLTADIKLPGVTFKRAGTGVMTRILVLDKDTSGKPAGGGQMNIDYSNIQDVNELFDKIHALDVPKRPDIMINASEIGMSYIETDKSYIAELSGFSGASKPAKMVGKTELRKIAERYFGEVRTNQGYWDDTHYAFETEKDRQRFAKAVLDTYNKEFKREKTPEIKFSDSDEIKFSKVSVGEKPEPVRLPTDSLTKQEVVDFVEKFKREYNGNIPIKFNIFGNTHEAYGSGVPTGQVAGGYSDKRNEIDLFADSHATDERVSRVPDVDAIRERDSGSVRAQKETGGFVLRDTVRHELLGHFGLNTFSPADKAALLGRVLSTRGNPAFADLWKSVDKNYRDAPPALKAEEVFAKAAEIEPSKLGRVWTNIVDHFQRLLQKVGLIDRPLTRTQLQATINRIEKGLKSGAIQQQTFSDTPVKFKKQSTEDVETIANDFIDQYQGLSNVNVLVVPNQDSLAEITNSSIEAGTTVKGAYMPASDTIVMVADNLANADDARRVLRHELIAHKGLMQSLSPSDVNLLTKQVMNLTNAKPLADIWKTVNRSYKNAPDAIKAEEVIARIAEEPRGTFGQVADQVISWVTGAMRRTGLLSRDKVTVEEIRNMLNNVDKNLRTNSGQLTNPRIDITRFSQVVNNEPDVSLEQALSARENAILAGIKKQASRFGWDSLKENWMATLTLRQIVEMKDKAMGGRLGKYLDNVNQMLVVQNTLAEQVAERVDNVQRWARKNRPAADQMFSVMHNSTLENVDPSAKFESMLDTLRAERDHVDDRLKAFIGTAGETRRSELINRRKEIDKEIKNEPLRRQAHLRMKREFDKLTPEAKEHFKNMRDHYIEQRGRMQQTLMDNIEKAKVNDKAKAQMLRQLRFDMERAKKGLYFPLARFGKYWIDSVDKSNGERYFMMYDTQAEMESAKRKLEASGYKPGEDFTSGQKLEQSRAMEGASMGFVNDVINELQTANVNQKARDDLTDTVYQLYLQAMPERSIRRNFIHRKGVAGYNEDAIRAMADQGVKQSRQQARLEFADELEEQLLDIRNFAEKSRNVDITRVANEMTKRHDWVKNPSRGKVAQKLTSLGFYWMLGASPASALVNLTQTVQIGIGVLGSRHGIAKSSAAVGVATKDFTNALASAWRNKGKRGVMYYGLSGHEREAIQYGIDIGALDTTQAADVMNLAENPSATYNGRIDGALRKIGFMFHYAEIMNREVTYMAAYRMEFAKNGGDSAAAAKYAVQATWDSHFDYGSLNRARFMQGDLAAVALQFKQYSQSMTYFLASNVFKSIKGATPEEKRTARRQLTWTLGSTFLIAGGGALPLMSVVMGAINMANDMFGDEDEPWDAETEFKAMLTEYFGEEVSKQVWYGVSPSLSGRISLNDLWIRDPNRDLDPEQWGVNMVQNMLGPTIGGVGFQFLRGLKDVQEGNLLRGAESMLPKSVKDVIRTSRYISEGGIANRKGDLLVEDLDVLELTGQVLGFVPSRSVYRYDQNNAMKSYEQAAIKRRSGLLSSYYMAWRNRDAEAMRNIQKEIRTYNRSKWGRANPISAKNIKQSIKRRQKNLTRSDRGLLVTPKLERLIDQSAYWS